MKNNFFKTHKFYIILVVIILTIGFFKLLSPDYTVRWDIYNVQYHDLKFISDSYQETGQLPLWNPYHYSGYPSFADPQPAMFYPFHLLLILFNGISLVAIKLLLFSHLLLAGVMMYLLAWELFKQKNISFLLGVIYAMSGFLVGHTSHLGIVYSYAWLPLVYLLLYKATKNKSLGQALWAGIVGALIILAGHSQSTLVIFVFLNLSLVYLMVRRYLKKKSFKSVLFIIYVMLIFNILAIGLSAIQLLPTQEFAGLSLRSDISLDISQTESLEPRSLATLVVPNFFDAVTMRQYWGPWSATQHYLYIGIAPLLLAFIGIFYSPYKHRLYFVSAGLVVLSYALGKFFIVQPFFYKFIPLFDKIRAPSNVFGLVIFPLVILAGYGLYKLINIADSEKTIFLGKLKKLNKYIIWIMVVSFLVSLFFTINNYFNVTRVFGENWKLINITIGVFVSLCLIFIILLLLKKYLQNKISKNKMILLLSIVILIDLLGFTVMNKLVASRGDIKASELKSEVQEYFMDLPDENFRVHTVDQNKFQAPVDIRMTTGYNPLNLRTYAEFLNTANIAETFFDRVMDSLNVKYSYNESFDGFDKKWESINVDIYKNTGQPEYAWFVSEVKGLEETQPKEQIFRLIKSDLKTTAWVDDKYTQEVVGNYDLSESEISLASFEPNRVELEVKNERTGFLVISEIYYPGWKVEVNGQVENLYQVDGTLRGLKLDPGNHQVVMKFNPATFNLGKTITYIFLGIGIIVISLLVSLKYRQNPKNLL